MLISSKIMGIFKNGFLFYTHLTKIFHSASKKYEIGTKKFYQKIAKNQGYTVNIRKRELIKTKGVHVFEIVHVLECKILWLKLYSYRIVLLLLIDLQWTFENVNPLKRELPQNMNTRFFTLTALKREQRLKF